LERRLYAAPARCLLRQQIMHAPNRLNFVRHG
jgi:hypothetical protein